MWYANMASDMTIPLIFNGTSNDRIECNCNKIKSTRFFLPLTLNFMCRNCFLSTMCVQICIKPNIPNSKHPNS